MSESRTVYVNTRVRLQRLSDAKFFAGWIKSFSPSDLVVSMTHHIPTDPGEAFMIQVHGLGSSALFQAKLLDAAGGEFHFSIPESTRLMSSNEEPRVAVPGVTAVVTGDEGDVHADVVDLGSNGVGVLTASKLARGGTVSVAFRTPVGPIDCVATVTYCRVDSKDKHLYRAGLELGVRDRIGSVRWRRLMVFQDRRKADRRANPRLRQGEAA